MVKTFELNECCSYPTLAKLWVHRSDGSTDEIAESQMFPGQYTAEFEYHSSKIKDGDTITISQERIV